MLKPIFYVALGSAIGGVCRYLMQQAVQRRVLTNFPLGTLLVNLLGCFVIGVVYGLAAKNNILSPMGRLFLATGICGGFTTYSSFMYENYTMVQAGEVFNTFLFVAISLVVGFLATSLGVLSVRVL